MISDHEFDPIDPEEEARRREEEAFARRVRREVRRIDRGEVDEELQREEEEEERRREQERLQRERAERRRNNIFVKMVNGTIMNNVHLRYPAIIAAMFLVSIMAMFRSLRLDMRYSRLEQEVQMLHERSLRLEEERYRKGSHSAVVEELRRRGIDIHDPQRPGEIMPGS